MLKSYPIIYSLLEEEMIEFLPIPSSMQSANSLIQDLNSGSLNSLSTIAVMPWVPINVERV